VRAYDKDFTALSDDELESAYETGEFPFVSGETVTFPVEVEQVDDDRFLRWQADCLPGAPA
jgi:hypothetical protein